MPLMRLAYGDSIGSYNNLFSVGIFSEGKWIKKLLMKSRAAILIASIPRLAPRVPAPISDGISISLMFFIKSSFAEPHQINSEAGPKGLECANTDAAIVLME